MFAAIAWEASSQEHLLQHARDQAPRECAALLAGSAAGTTACVQQVLPLPNTAIADDAFTVDAVAFARCEYELRKAGLTLLGFAHSHPGGNPTPSRRDQQELWSGYLQVITDGQHCRAYCFAADRSMRLLKSHSEATA